MDVMSLRIYGKQDWNAYAVVSSRENTQATTKMHGWNATVHVGMRCDVTFILKVR